MIRFQRSLAMAAAGAMLLIGTAASAEATRPGSSIPTVSKAVTQDMSAQDTMGKRSSKRVKSEEQIVGGFLLPLLIGLGVAIAAAVAVASGNNDSRG